MGKPIIIEDYNPNWIVKFEEEKRHLRAIMKDKAIAIAHVGSTSVKGLGAKEIIDIMMGIQHLKDVEKFMSLTTYG
ncbi:GrpB family protein [Priestia megaterium]|uniref:GrpB family protein n=1 Tax=Priestia megaterium TaxID=1404 RepID=UPI00204116BE|nr:GrpB family protein [Priestia megaterium]MCM3541833.1 GrpB family protein [Priestia megaterium]